MTKEEFIEAMAKHKLSTEILGDDDWNEGMDDFVDSIDHMIGVARKLQSK